MNYYKCLRTWTLVMTLVPSSLEYYSMVIIWLLYVPSSLEYYSMLIIWLLYVQHAVGYKSYQFLSRVCWIIWCFRFKKPARMFFGYKILRMVFTHILTVITLRYAYPRRHLGPDSIYRWHLTSIGNPIVEIRRSYDRLISTMGFPMLVRRHLYIESGPWLVLLPPIW